jgi:transketolase
VIDRKKYSSAEGLRRGAYVLWESQRGNAGKEGRGGEGRERGEDPEIILIGTGSEVQVALDAGQILDKEDGYRVRVVSMPCWELFDAQPARYRRAILPPSVRARVAVEAGLTMGWEHYVGLDGAVVGIDTFGASAPADVLFKKFGITPERVAQTARRLLQRAEGAEEVEKEGNRRSRSTSSSKNREGRGRAKAIPRTSEGRQRGGRA